MKLQNSPASLQTRAFRFWTCIVGGGVGGEGDDDDIVMQTPRTTSPEEPSYSVFSSTFVMSDHLI